MEHTNFPQPPGTNGISFPKLTAVLAKQLGKFFGGIAVFLTVLVCFIGWWVFQNETTSTIQYVTFIARESFRKDLLYRKWATVNGGVYVPVSLRTPINPFLVAPEREVTTPSGRILTLINPAYMTRQVYELGGIFLGTKSHITSLNPLRPRNGPDEWEKIALRSFETGLREFASFTEISGEKHLRFMGALITEEGCLKCHAVQGYKVGEIRGGISISINWAPYQEQLTAHLNPIFLGLTAIWAAGLLVTGMALKLADNFFRGEIQAEMMLAKHLNHLEELVTERTRARVAASKGGPAWGWRSVPSSRPF